MYVDLRMASVMAEAKRQELARSYRGARRQPKRADSRAAEGSIPATPVVRRLLLGR